MQHAYEVDQVLEPIRGHGQLHPEPVSEATCFTRSPEALVTNLLRDVRGHRPPQLPFFWGVREVLRGHGCQGTRNVEILVVAGAIEDSEVSG